MADIDDYPNNLIAPKKFLRKYSDELADEITDYYISGMTVAAIARMQGMPSAPVMYRWMKEIPYFRKQMDNAKTIRALAMADEALETARESYQERHDKDKVSAARLLFDAATWTAEKADPMTFGKQIKVEGGLAPMQIIVNTGLQLPDAEQEKLPEPQPNAIADESGETEKSVSSDSDTPTEGA